MGALHEKSSSPGNTTGKVSEELGIKDKEEGFGNDGVVYFQLFLCLRWQRFNNGERVSLLQGRGGENRDESLWIRRLKKEITGLFSLLSKRNKIVIRKLRAYTNNVNTSKRRPNFQYDLQSYALNFDEGQGKDHDSARIDFSSRFSASLKKDRKKLLSWVSDPESSRSAV